MFDDLLAANRRFASTTPPEAMPAQASRHLAVVTCMDTRIDPLAVLGLQVGEAKILRNAGGRVTDDTVRSLALATAFLGVTMVVVMHHSRCALAGTSDEEVRASLSTGQRAALAEQPLLAMPDPDAALAVDVASVRRSAALPAGLVVEGWRYDVDTGEVHRFVTA